MNRLWTLRILGIFFILSALGVIYYDFTHSGKAPFWRDAKAKLQNIYEVPGVWQDETGTTLRLSSLKGQTSMISFVFLDCEMTCPRIMADLKALDEAYGALPKPKPPLYFQIFLFKPPEESSIDTKEFRKRYGIEGRRHWRILWAKKQDRDRLADVFSLNYADAPDGSRKYKHTNFYALISPHGRVLEQKRGFLGDLPKLAKRIREIPIDKE